MPSRYKNEQLITLAEAKVKFGYTPDHLAYLCRTGFVWAERHGRLWLTCEKAVADYKTKLEKHGKPVRLNILENPEQGMLMEVVFTAFKPAAKLLADTSGFAKYLLRLYRSIFARKRQAYKHVDSRFVKSGFWVGESPFNLPSCPLPRTLRLSPWYAEKLVIVPLFFMIFGVMCLQFLAGPAKPFLDSASVGLKNFGSEVTWNLRNPFDSSAFSVPAMRTGVLKLASAPQEIGNASRLSGVAQHWQTLESQSICGGPDINLCSQSSPKNTSSYSFLFNAIRNPGNRSFTLRQGTENVNSS